MPSQAELLRKTIAGVEAELGPDAAILKDLRQQLASLESRSKGPRENPITFEIGIQGGREE